MNWIVICTPAVWAVILIVQSLLALYIRYSVMGEKFFLDSLGLLQIIQSGYFLDGSFDFAANILSLINFFDLYDLMSWSIYIMVLYFVINWLIVKNIRILTLKDFLCLLLAIFLWYLFAAGVTKEVVQGIFYLLIYFIIYNFKIRPLFKIVFCIAILLICATYFREYYILIAFYALSIYLFFMFSQYHKRLKTASVILLYCLILLFVLLLVSKSFLADYFDILLNLRGTQYLYLVENTDSFISDVIGNDSSSIGIYCLNYCINFIRLIFPIELLFIGKIYYLPFLLYMLLCSSLLIYRTKVCKADCLTLTILWSFYIVAPMFEPDFGSWARHQTVMWIFIANLMK